MAQRRMFSKRIIESARFLKMPVSTQALYFHLGLHADDDGVVEAYPIMMQTGTTEDDLKILAAKGFIKILNEDLVSYILDWRENNRIRSDRKVDSIYKELLLQILPEIELQETRQRADTKKKTINGQPMDDQRTTNGQHRLGKVRLGKVILNNKDDKEEKIDFNYKEFIDWFNKLANKSYRDTEQNRKYIKARLNEGYTKEDIAKVVKFKVKEWKDNSDMNKYLRFKTLFAPTHFADYLQEAEDAFEPQEKENKSHSSSQPELSEQEEREKRILMYVEENPEVLTKDTPNNLTIRKEYEKINERNRNKGNSKPTQ